MVLIKRVQMFMIQYLVHYIGNIAFIGNARINRYYRLSFLGVVLNYALLFLLVKFLILLKGN